MKRKQTPVLLTVIIMNNKEMGELYNYKIEYRDELLRALDQILDHGMPELAPGYMVINEKIRHLNDEIEAIKHLRLRVVK